MQWRVMAVGLALTAASGIGLGAEHVQLAAEQTRITEAEIEFNRGQMAPRGGMETLRLAHDLVARGDARNTCGLFDDRAEIKFAAAWQAPTCEIAVQRLAAQITDFRRWPSFASGSVRMVELPGGTIVDGCSLTWGTVISPQPAAGPGFGRLEIAPIPGGGGGREIVDYDACPSQPIPSGNVVSPPTTSERPAMSPGMRRRAPMYPPAYGQIMGRAIANADSGICQLFVGDASSQFATSHGATTCEEAIIMMQPQVSNPTWYATQPGGITTSHTPEGHTVVHACNLSWKTVSGSRAPAGPPIGHLITSAGGGGGAAGGGYVIIGYQPC